MPTAIEHLQKYDANRLLLDSCNGKPLVHACPCWAVTVAFYAALHLVERLASRSGITNRDHTERMNYVRDDHPTITTSYRILMDAAKTARYFSRASFDAKYRNDTVQKYHIDHYLKQIEDYAFNVQPRQKPTGS
jgi:hypothetical protein